MWLVGSGCCFALLANTIIFRRLLMRRSPFVPYYVVTLFGARITCRLRVRKLVWWGRWAHVDISVLKQKAGVKVLSTRPGQELEL